jgi:hypothetical protein
MKSVTVNVKQQDKIISKFRLNNIMNPTLHQRSLIEAVMMPCRDYYHVCLKTNNPFQFTSQSTDWLHHCKSVSTLELTADVQKTERDVIVGWLNPNILDLWKIRPKTLKLRNIDLGDFKLNSFGLENVVIEYFGSMYTDDTHKFYPESPAYINIKNATFSCYKEDLIWLKSCSFDTLNLVYTELDSIDVPTCFEGLEDMDAKTINMTNKECYDDLDDCYLHSVRLYLEDDKVKHIKSKCDVTINLECKDHGMKFSFKIIDSIVYPID